MIDEGPSPEDLERFGGDTAHCPSCGAEIYDAAEQCPECKVWIRGATTRRTPVEQWLRQRWWLFVVIVVVIAFLMLVL